MTSEGDAMATASASWINHPGFYIKEEMEERGWSQRDLAFILGCSEQVINPILNGKRSISSEMAKALGDAFDVPAEFFANLQQAYDLAQARNPDPSVAARRLMQTAFPVRDMIKRGWIEQSDADMLNTQLQRFFDVPELAHAAKKPNYEDISPAQLAWLYRVRQIAKSMNVPPYSQKNLSSSLTDLQMLLYSPEEARNVPRIMLECGVRFILVEKLPQADIDGVCFWLDSKSPVIGMSTRRDKIDNFWFVLRHEIQHVLEGHGQKREMVDTDLEGEQSNMTEEEKIANQAAADFCAPTAKLDSFMLRKRPFFYEKDVIAFSRLLNRHPGLIIGQMQRRLKDYRYLARHLVKIRHFVLPGSIADGWGQVVPVSL
jgi:HTH-type transcriptional regulator / antitoxin HigA